MTVVITMIRHNIFLGVVTTLMSLPSSSSASSPSSSSSPTAAAAAAAAKALSVPPSSRSTSEPEKVQEHASGSNFRVKLAFDALCYVLYNCVTSTT